MNKYIQNQIEVSKNAIDLEILRREKLKREEFRKQFDTEVENSFWGFCKYIDPEFFIDEKTLLYELATILHGVSLGKYKKVLVSMMPRAGKSYVISLWCVWSLGHNPTKTIMRNTYGAKLANKFSRDIRNMIGIPGEKETEINKKVKRVFPSIKLSHDKKSVEEWALATAKDISYFCGGAGGAITGFGCNLAMILDDPIKNMEEARSENRLEDVERWYHSTHRTRRELNSDCAEIIIMTRWSINDTIGKRLDTEKGEWKQFLYPAIVDGKSICEAIAPTKELLSIRKGMIASNMEDIWWSLYMSEPYEERGVLFPLDKIKRYTRQELVAINDSHCLSFVDFADGGGDYFCAVFGVLNGNDVYVKAVIFSKKDAESLESDLISKVIVNRPLKMVFEANSGGKMYSLLIKRKVKEFYRTTIACKRTNTNKVGRIISWSGIILENFRFLAPSEYSVGSEYDLFMKNLTSFTRDGKNTNDDAPDSCAGLASMIGIRSGGVKVNVIGGS